MFSRGFLQIIVCPAPRIEPSQAVMKAVDGGAKKRLTLLTGWHSGSFLSLPLEGAVGRGLSGVCFATLFGQGKKRLLRAVCPHLKSILRHVSD